MKKTYLTALSLMFAAGAIVTASNAAVGDAGQFYVAPGLQLIDYDKSRLLDDETGFALGLGYDFTNKLSGEINIFDMDLDGTGPDKDVFHSRFDLLYTLDKQIGALTPFVVGGVGHNRFSQNEETVFDAGAGVKYQINDNLVWRTAVKKFWGMDEHFHDYGIDTSLVFSFGGSSSAPSAPASAPARAAAASPDQDGDGVPDSRDACADTPRTHRVDNTGCSIVTEEVARIDLVVHFDFDQAVVKPEYLDEIQRVADFLNANPNTIADLEGHTDAVGTDEYNQSLSERRVNAIRQVLIERFGIEPGKVRAQGLGESRPVASNDTAEGRAQNRRVQSVMSATLQRFESR